MKNNVISSGLQDMTDPRGGALAPDRRKTLKSSAGSPNYLYILTFCGCLLVSFAYQAISMDAVIGLYDEGNILFGARRVMDGDLIHRDFYSNYGPGQFYTIAMLFKLFSPSVLVERLWDCFVRSFSVAIIFLLVSRPTRSILVGLGTAAASMVWLQSFGFYGYPVFPALAAALTGLLCLLFAFDQRRSIWPLPAAGVCVGVAFLFRYDIGIATAGVMAALLGLHAATEPASVGRRLRNAARSVGLFAVGFAAVAVPLIGALIVNGAIHDLIFQVVTYPSKYYYDTRSLPFPTLRQVIRNFAVGSVYLPLLLAAVAAGGLVSDRRNPPTSDDGSSTAMLLWAQITLIALTLLYFVKGFVRVSPVHMSMAIVCALALTGIAGTGLKARHGPWRAGLVAALALTAGITIGLGVRNVIQTRDRFRAPVADVARPVSDLPSEPVRTSCGALTGVQRFTCFSIDQDHLNTLVFLKAHTHAGDYIYIGLDRHDKVFINDVALYFLADLRSATKWHQFDPGLQTSAPIQQEMIDDIKRHPPRYVVLESQWDDILEPNASAQSSGIVLLDKYIRRNFRAVATFGTISVYRDSRS
jgi:hypothetical protein